MLRRVGLKELGFSENGYKSEPQDLRTVVATGCWRFYPGQV